MRNLFPPFLRAIRKIRVIRGPIMQFVPFVAFLFTTRSFM